MELDDFVDNSKKMISEYWILLSNYVYFPKRPIKCFSVQCSKISLVYAAAFYLLVASCLLKTLMFSNKRHNQAGDLIYTSNNVILIGTNIGVD